MKSTDKHHHYLMKLLGQETPKQRKNILNKNHMIICDYLCFKLSDLPWRNSNKHEEKWDKLMRGLRLMIARIDMEFDKKNRTLH